ncbi:GrpB family protein [Bacillus sp. 1P06AnD]|uniref:GrpB family protein n=1 Tax=Bacillus sp. 1P06AnD TaxID=3132208 RepID=UPI0039A124F3
MELGLGNDEVRLVSFSEAWKDEFAKTKDEIQSSTGIKEAYIEHIGSTAIKGMPSKPIIDLLVAVESLDMMDDNLVKQFKIIGFHRLKVKRPNEIVFAKFKDPSYEVKTHYIHLVEYGKELWKNLLFFRDYLNANKQARLAYAELKMDYANRATTGIIAYTDYKEAFVTDIFSKRVE